jgi:hypothetical protein
MLMYFGQEVGVASSGPKGFQGDDGRTTIFDYWVRIHFLTSKDTYIDEKRRQ